MGNVFQEKLGPKLTAMSKHHYVRAIQSGVMSMIGVTIFSSIMVLLKTPPVSPASTNPIAVAWMNFAANNADWLGVAVEMSMNMYGLIALIGVTYSLAEHFKIDKKNAIIVSIVSFLIVSIKLVPVERAVTISYAYLGSKGLFAAFVISILNCEILRYWETKGPSIKLPDAVPPMVSEPFKALISTIALLSLAVVIRVVCGQFGILFPQLIEAMLKPLLGAADSLLVFVLMIALSRVLWLFGIHGTSIVMSVLSPIMIMNTVENLAAYEAGVALPHTLTFGSLAWQLGMLPAAIAMIMVAKSAQLKSVSKVGIIPSMFMISEPILFGTPFIFNTTLFIPQVVAFSFSAGVGYFLQSTHMIGRNFMTVPWVIPGPFGVYLATLDWKAPLAWFAVLAICILIYLPFIKKYDAKLLKEETEREAEKAA